MLADLWPVWFMMLRSEAPAIAAAVVRRSKPETCPVRALRTWLETSGITEGALFRWIDRHGKMHDRLRGAAVA
jgi:hypothetical protein